MDKTVIIANPLIDVGNPNTLIWLHDYHRDPGQELHIWNTERWKPFQNITQIVLPQAPYRKNPEFENEIYKVSLGSRYSWFDRNKMYE